VSDLCASVQAAIVDVLVKKTVKAANRLGVRCVTASGGVTCNCALRRELAAACKSNGLILRLAEKELCTDNAAMIGILAERKLRQSPTIIYSPRRFAPIGRWRKIWSPRDNLPARSAEFIPRVVIVPPKPAE